MAATPQDGPLPHGIQALFSELRAAHTDTKQWFARSDFDLDFDPRAIQAQWEEKRTRRPLPYKRIRQNVYVCDKAALCDDQEDVAKGGCDNQRFQKRQWRDVVARNTKQAEKGHGLFTREKLHAGDFVIEFVGEVIDDVECERRFSEQRQTGERHVFMIMVQQDIVIDARRKGNLSRFTNHSCRPNMEIQKWSVNGCLRLGLFALRDIPEGEELTIDYRFTHFTAERWKCLCGEPECAGWMDASSAERIAAANRVQGNQKKRKGKKRKRRTEAPVKVSSLSLLWNAQWDEDEADEAGFAEQRLFVVPDGKAPKLRKFM
eukprot:g6257.t1